jgi:hypothetical protein
MKTTKRAAAILILGLIGCAGTGGGEPSVVSKPKLAKAGLLPSAKLPAERDGVRVEDTGAVMFVCANSDKHADKEVLISRCPHCSEVNYFFRDYAEEAFRCYACTKLLENDTIRCPECGRPPRTIRTKNKPKTA